MIVCPVCEHAQPEGAECEVCGKRFGRAAIAAPVPLLEGLETTSYDGGGVPVPTPIPELEPTRHGPAALVVADAPPDVERTAAAPVDVDAAPLPDLERTRAELPGDGPTPLPAQVLCRYCRTPAGPGERICGRCGMRLPVIAAPPREAAQAAGPRLCSCGAPVSGALCPACGARCTGG
ncbi:hypothetical protein [Anaeromyxobacter oryzae]|uniref:DZANK-type domain-containing protein n=1 Tax=Anaeromyxobacter oryzae TaxID=2918170 RepID=A0ABN6N3T3_9BACT|nr:hypothetical protein [Anaeromyxobacter oryzae]BDG06599.1 hypothetical protein AMOR_55950 [Anaeromyxobacter oryzae]